VIEPHRAPERQPQAAFPPAAPAGVPGGNPGWSRSHRRLVRTVSVLVGVALLAAGCSNATPTAPPTEPPEDVSTETDQAETTEAASTTEEPEDPAATEPPGEEELLETWEAFHSAWTSQAPLDEPDPDAFDGLAVDPAETAAFLAAQRLDGRTVTLEQQLWPRVDVDGEQASITDCVIATQHPAGQPDTAATVTVGWEATAIVTDSGWLIDLAEPVGLFCIAEELNDQLLDAYRDYRAARKAAWDPPDPDHPALEATMTGEHLEFIRDLLAQHQAEGIVVRDPAPTDNAVVFEVGIGTATVSDCAEQVDERGAFDLETGKRLDELIPPVREGQLDAQSVELVVTEGGVWKVNDQAGTRDTNCVQGSTRYEVR
jgi:hypothetical protein